MQSSFDLLQWHDYGSLVILTAVLYDFVLVFPEEIEYIWNKPWTRVSTLFIVVRYCGLLNLVCVALNGTTFIHDFGEYKMCVLGFVSTDVYFQLTSRVLNSCQMMNLTMQWSFLLFFSAADSIMILRVWAMYHRSKLVLGILLVLFFIEVISNVACDLFNSIPKTTSLVANQIMQYAYCAIAAPSLDGIVLEQVAYASLIVFAVTLCLLATVQFVMQSLQMYRMTQQWQLNRYANALVKQGIVYFFAFLMLNVISLLYSWGKIPTSIGLYLLSTFVMYVPVYTLPPRFIIGIRELHENHHDKHWQASRNEGIDAGFGLSVLSDRSAPRLHIVFEFEGREENSMEEDIEACAAQS